MMNFIRTLFVRKDEKTIIEEYLADSLSLSDLERRQRLIARGEAPWQLRAKQNLKGWI
jgi:hypothetical protein